MKDNNNAVLEKLSDFSLCQQHRTDQSICLKALDVWLKENPNDSWNAAKIVRINFKDHLALKYFKKAENTTRFNCLDQDLKKSILSALNVQNDDNVLLLAKSLVFNKCINSLPELVSNKLKPGTKAYKIFCKDLNKKNLLKQSQKLKCR